MAALIGGPCWLSPVPASDRSFTANPALARAIADMVPDVRVKCAISRAYPIESSHDRHLEVFPIHQHASVRTVGPVQVLPVYFPDTQGTEIWRKNSCIKLSQARSDDFVYFNPGFSNSRSASIGLLTTDVASSFDLGLRLVVPFLRG